MAPAQKRWITDGLDLGPDRSVASPMDFPPPVPSECRSSNDSIVFLGPPPIADENAIQRANFECERSTVEFPIDRLLIRPRELDVGGRQKSAGWLGSLLLHLAIVILIAFLFAPADFGGVSTQTLVLTQSDDVPEFPIPMMLVDEVALEDSSLLSEEELEREEIEPMDVKFEIGRPSIRVGGTKTISGRSRGNVGGGARGSFFGIEAVGQEFVYVVDRSGSMNGNRYRRALEELKRSVDELREDQRFLVILFSSNSVPMLGQSERATRMIEATKENKNKLKNWLATINPGGGTNPNSSLRTALRMNPSAVFMLSDGEFTESKKRRRGGLLQAGGSAYSIVEASGAAVPIHAIAFEDPRSCKNMKRLAEASGGEYRFVNSSGKTQAQLLAEAKDLMSQPKSKSRNMNQIRLCYEIGTTQVPASMKQVIANLLLDEYESEFGKIEERKPDVSVLDIEETVQLLESLVAIDANRTACADLQDKVAGQLSWILTATAEKEVVEEVCDQLIRWRRYPATVSVLDRLVDHFVSLNKNEPEKAFGRLRLVKTMHPQSKVVPVCQAVCDEIIDGVIGKSNEFLEEGDLASAVKTLRAIQSNQQVSALKSVARKTLHELTMDQLVAARDASLRHDTDAKDEINEQLENGFESDPLLEQCRKELVSREMNARRLLQQVEQDNVYSGLKIMRQQLESIVQRFPEAIAAKKAKQRLAQLPKWEAARDKEQEELIRMMDDTRRQ